MTFEIRSAEMWPDADYEMRATPEGFTFEGYAAVYNLPSVPMAFADIGGGRRFREVIHPGAFTDTLSRNPDVTLRYQHNMNALPLARTTSGTMTLSEDVRGLRVQATLPDNDWGRPMRDAVARGDISGMSFRFRNAKDDWSQDGRMRIRNIRQLDIGPEVSITDYPAYPDTVAMVRAVVEALKAEPADVIAELSEALTDAQLGDAERQSLIAIINGHSDVPVLSKDGIDKLAQMRERLDSLKSPAA